MDLYRKRRREADAALELLRSGSRVLVGSGCAEPGHLVRALARRARHLADVELIQVISLGHSAWGPETEESFQPRRFFVAGAARQPVAEDRGAYTPMYLSEVARLIRRGPLAPDAVLIQVSPPDEHGFVSLGVSVDVVPEAVAQARVVIAQVNPRMPRTLGATFLHVSELSALVEQAEELATYQPAPPDQRARRIARHVAKLIADGSTLHLGLGRLPQAVLAELGDKRDLGVHSDLFTEAYLDLVEAGVITGAAKSLHPRRIVASYCLGSERLFRFVHDNPQVELHPVRYTNDPAVIGRNRRMMAVHEAVQVDLTGQVCADVVGGRIYAGIGSMVDFTRGANRSPGGQSIIVLPSTGPEGESNIRAAFPPGAGVVLTRAGVRTVVTEYGPAFLHGLTLSERAVALIDIAHPNHRDGLLTRARQLGLIRPGRIQVPLFTGIYPEEYEKSLTLTDGSAVLLRPVKPTDERLVRDFFYAMKSGEVYYRFLHAIKVFPRKDMQRMVNIDYHREMTILALAGRFDHQELAGLGRYVLGPAGMPEVDFAVGEKYQGRGLGRVILQHLVHIARDRGYPGLSAVVLNENRASYHILTTLGYVVTGTVSQGVTELTIHFDRPVEKPRVDIKYAGQGENPPEQPGDGQPLIPCGR